MRNPTQKEISATTDSDMSGPIVAGNVVACSAADAPHRAGLRNPSGISNSKRSDAAALAIDLASNGSWSEVLSPSAASTQGGMIEYSLNSQRPSLLHNHPTSEYTDLGSPPEYSSSDEHDVTPNSGDSDTEDMHHSSSRQERTALMGPVYSDTESDSRQDLDAPLLGEESEKSPDDNLRTRTHELSSFRRNRLRWLHAGMGVLVIMIAVGLFGYLIGGRQNLSSQPNLPSILTERVHVQHETSGEIRGRFELYDRLELTTTTGTIDIQIDLQPGNGTAELILGSSTGAIKLGISDSWWSRGTQRTLRPVHTEIKTLTGSIYGRILLGQGGYASIDSVTGQQDLKIYVYDATLGDQTSELITRSRTGTQTVAVTHFGARDTTISNLKAEHHSLATGSLDLQYSHAWRGKVHAVSSGTGRLEVQGDADLVFDKKEAHEVLAHKGKDKHRQTVEVISDGTGSACFKSWYTW